MKLLLVFNRWHLDATCARQKGKSVSLYEGLCVSADLHVLFNKLNQSVIRDVGKWRDTKNLSAWLMNIICRTSYLRSNPTKLLTIVKLRLPFGCSPKNEICEFLHSIITHYNYSGRYNKQAENPTILYTWSYHCLGKTIEISERCHFCFFFLG